MRSLLLSLLSLALGCSGCRSGKGDPDAFVPEDGAMDAPMLDGAPDGSEPPPPVEVCDNGLDDDGDGEVDCADLDCASAPLEPEVLQTADEVPFADRVRFLWEGAACPPIQRDVEADALVDSLVSVVRGVVLNEDGEPFGGVRVFALGQDSWGHTITRANGEFDFAVNGSRPVILSFVADGHLVAQRRARPVAGDFVAVMDVVMVPVGEPQTVDLTVGGVISLATSDDDGARTLTALFPPNVRAETGPADAPVSLSSLTIRPRELTVGELGPLRMAGELPPASGYTYAVELGVEGANGHVRFEADAGSEARVGPVILHIDNFLGFAVGEGVPVGAYERDAGRWVAESNGLVVGLVGEVEGLAELDFDGDGAPESEEVLAAWAVTEFELRQLASQREPGDTFWRVPTSHFSLIDCNWPLAFPTDAIDALLAFLGLDAFTEDTCYNGSEIRLERQVLAEHMDIPGTPFSLTYSSDRQVGYEANRTVRVQVTPDSIPSSMRQVHVELLIAGRRVRRTYPAAPSLIFEYAWDGTDVYGRRFRGAMPYEIRVGYGYQGTYASSAIASRDPFPTEGGGWFGFPGTSRNDRTLTREEVIRWRSERRFLSYDDARREGLLGLTLDVHHRYEPTSQTLLRGDGGRARARAMPLVIDRVAGGGSSTSPDVPARSFRLQSPTGLTVGDDGQVYVATNDSRIWRIDRDGILHHFAGNGDNATSGDGGLAVDAGIANPEHLAWGPDGSLYIGCVSEAASDECARIRRVRPDGVIETVAGNGTNARRMGDGLRAVDAPLEEPRLLAFGDDGTLYFVDGALYLRAVGTDGVLRTLNPSRRSSDDGTLLASADLGSIGGLAYDARDGSLYVGSNRRGGTIYRVTPDGFLRRYAGGNGAPDRDAPTPLHVQALDAPLGVPSAMVVSDDRTITFAVGIGAWLRRIRPDGVLEELAGRASDWPGGDGGAAVAATLVGTGQLALGPSGDLYLTDINPANRVRRIAPSFGARDAGEWVVPSEDGAFRYVFNSAGRHLRTETANVGYPLLAFRYDPTGLIAVDDDDGNTVDIVRSPGRVTIRSNQGPATELVDDDGDGYADRMLVAGEERVSLGWNDRGLLARSENAWGVAHVYGYDEEGLLVSDGFEGYPAQTITAFEDSNRVGVTLTTAAGRTETLSVEQVGATVSQRRTDGVGLVTTYERNVEGHDITTFSDGTVQEAIHRPDVLLGPGVPVPQEIRIRAPSGRELVRTLDQRVTRDPDTGLLSSRRTTITHAAGTAFEGTIEQELVVNPDGGATTTFTTGGGRVGRAIQDATGKLIRIERPGRHAIRIAHDAHGRVIEMRQGPDGAERVVTYDLPPLPSESFEPISSTDATGRTTLGTADTLGRVSSVSDAAGSMSIGYDDPNRTETVTPPGRAAHRHVFDDRGRLTEYHPPAVAEGETPTTYSYDDDGVRTGVEFPDGNTLLLEVDGANRFVGTTVTEGTAAERAHAVALDYEPNGVLGAMTWSEPSGTVVLDPVYDGSLLDRVDMRGVVQATYDPEYDEALRLNQVTISAGGASRTLRYSFDEDGMSGGATLGAEVFDFPRDPASGDPTGLVTRSVATTIRIDEFGGLAERSSTWPGGRLGWTQIYDLGGRIESRTETGASTFTLVYGYDGAGRLTSVTRAGEMTAEYEYEYDANGNRIGWVSPRSTCRSGGDPSRCVETDGQDRLLRMGVAGAADTETFRYDARGRLRERRGRAGVTRLEYDPFDNLQSVTTPTGRVVRYVVDPLGRRVAREVDGVRTHGWVYGEGLAPIGQLAPDGSLESVFVYLSNDWTPDLVWRRDGRLFRVLSDPTGSVRVVIDLATNAIVQRYEYSPFGEVVVAEETEVVLPLRFAGGLYDELTGLIRFGARDYDPRVGRWLATDPLGFAAGDSNLYGYVSNDPINHIDPTGLSAETATDIFAAGGSCVYAPIRDALAGCFNFGAHARRCALALASVVMWGVSAGMLIHGAGKLGRLVRGGRGCFTDGTLVSTADGLVPIEAIEVGDYVLPYQDGCEATMPVDPVVVHWQSVEGRTVAVTQLLSANEAPQVGETRHLTGMEAVDGMFVATAMEHAAPQLESVVGCPVLGVVSRVATDRLDLLVSAGEREVTVATTSGHPFWSNDRQTWTPAADLRVGERVASATGGAVVLAVNPVSSPEVVHNLWIGDSHRYRVTDLELDVHNDCWLEKALAAMGKTRADIPSWMRFYSPHGHHIIPKGMQNLFSRRGRMVREMQSWAKKHRIDIVHDPRNLAVAPNGMDTHSEAGIRAVYDRLRGVRGSKSEFVAELEQIRVEMWRGTFYRKLGWDW